MGSGVKLGLMPITTNEALCHFCLSWFTTPQVESIGECPFCRNSYLFVM
jgi:hypothetical protein